MTNIASYRVGLLLSLTGLAQCQLFESCPPTHLQSEIGWPCLDLHDPLTAARLHFFLRIYEIFEYPC
jgi:hypothetical protein